MDFCSCITRYIPCWRQEENVFSSSPNPNAIRPIPLSLNPAARLPNPQEIIRYLPGEKTPSPLDPTRVSIEDPLNSGIEKEGTVRRSPPQDPLNQNIDKESNFTLSAHSAFKMRSKVAPTKD